MSSRAEALEEALENVVVFAGKDDEDYVDDVCNILHITRGELSERRYHSDSDPYLRILQEVGGKDVFFVSRYHKRTTETLFEMLNFANAALHEGANSVNVFETYLGCSRQERRSKPGEAVTLQVKAQCILANGISTFSTFAAHAPATILGFDPGNTKFKDVPLWPPMIQVISNTAGEDAKIKSVGPDAGSAKFVRDILDSTTVEEDDRFSADLAIVDKDRVHQENGQTKSGAIIGDVENVIASIFDDESVSGATICDAARICREAGAIGAYVALAHPKFAMDDEGTKRIKDALKERIIEKLVISNSCYLPPDFHRKLGLEEDSNRLVILPTQPLVAEYIIRSANTKGVPYLFSSRGVLKAYDNIAQRVRNAEQKERRDDHKEEYEENFRQELDIYNRMARPVLGPYQPIVRSHVKLAGCQKGVKNPK
ncbi:ribose-phosphate diphosphokinase [Nanoarchaeota archaeon]